MALAPRSEVLLSTLIQRYIIDGEPVGSQTLAKDSKLNVSPATIRNVMAELEDKGYLTSIHTSSGRVPTTKGYRLFIENLLTTQISDKKLTEQIKGELSSADDIKTYIKRAGDAISQMSHYAGIVLVPTSLDAKVRQVDFLELSPHRVLVIIVTQDGHVTNKIVQLKHPLNPSDLTAAANYFNDAYAGKSLHDVRVSLVNTMADDTAMMNSLMRNIVAVTQPIIEDSEQEEVYVYGEEQLLGIPDLSEMSQLRELFITFKTKQDLFDLLDRSMKGQGINIFIGEESGHHALSDLSVITAPFQNEGQRVGVLGVIGPTRMQYDRVIPMVDITAKLLTHTLARAKAENDG